MFHATIRWPNSVSFAFQESLKLWQQFIQLCLQSRQNLSRLVQILPSAEFHQLLGAIHDNGNLEQPH